MTSSAIVTTGIGKSFGDVIALRDLDLDVPEGAFFVLLGPSGAGKTTTLRVIAGVRPERFVVSASDVEPGAARGRVVSREALGDETIYVVETEAGLLNVRMPPTARFAEDQVVAVRHLGAAPPVYDPETEQVIGR